MDLFLIRHGQSEYQTIGESAGIDSILTPLGEKQAHKLGAYLTQMPSFDAIYASDLQRAHKTATIVAAYLSLPVNIEPGLREFDDFASGWAPLAPSMWDAYNPDVPFTPGFAGFRAQVLGALQRIVLASEHGQRILVFAHGGTIGTALRIVLGTDTPRLYVGNTAIQHMTWDTHPDYGSTWALYSFNNMEHLPPEMRTL